MKDKKFILAIDQGTSSTKSLLFDEQDPEGIIHNVMASVKNCLTQFTSTGYDLSEIAAIGISNQRETFVVWDRNGNPLYPAVVWQCKRSIHICEKLKQRQLSATI